ncbi:hypothetical protein GCM10010517_65090 [Streptosporangium fragile]|uniref:Helix-turn-helix domain-containing protein n=1 Tax=Streptosporangium fragile TaxID=46186 RepID=A0ABN3W7B5_9ACTN
MPLKAESGSLGKAVPPPRPQSAEARRMRAAELFEPGRSQAEIAHLPGVAPSSRGR